MCVSQSDGRTLSRKSQANGQRVDIETEGTIGAQSPVHAAGHYGAEYDLVACGAARHEHCPRQMKQTRSRDTEASPLLPNSLSQLRRNQQSAFLNSRAVATHLEDSERRGRLVHIL